MVAYFIQNNVHDNCKICPTAPKMIWLLGRKLGKNINWHYSFFRIFTSAFRAIMGLNLSTGSIARKCNGVPLNCQSGLML